jgi:lauroyl/myristoyl acyltransferase
MDKLLYCVARALLALLQLLPLTWVARLGRMGGALAYWLDARHRRVALRNLTLCFGGEISPAEIRALARENFRRIGENYACGARTGVMSAEELWRCVEFVADGKAIETLASPGAPNIVVAVGHFGNFELLARGNWFLPAYRCVMTYRGLRQPSLNRLMQSLRERSGSVFFERRAGATALKATMSQPRTMLGLVVDQHAGDGGLRLPFFGHECSTSAAPAVFALRYRCRLYTAICYRVALARWRIEPGPEIPTRENGAPRSSDAIMRDVNRALEAAIRRDPANWFWVHKRWRPAVGRDPQSEIRNSELAETAEGE